MRLGIRHKLLLYFFVPVLFITGLIEWVNYRQMMSLLKERQTFDFAVKANQLNLIFSRIANQAENSATFFRRDYLPLPRLDATTIYPLLEQYLKKYPDFSGISLSFVKDTLGMADSLKQYAIFKQAEKTVRKQFTHAQIGFLEQDYIKQVDMRTITTWIPTRKDSLRSDVFITSCSFPLIRNNRIEAVVTFDLPIEKVVDILEQVYKDVFHYTLLTGNHFSLIYSTEDSLIIRKSNNIIKLQTSILDTPSTRIVDSLMRREEATGIYNITSLNLKLHNGKELLLVTNKIRGLQWRLFIGIPLNDIREMAFNANLPRMLISLFLVLMLLSFLLMASGKVVKPILQMQQAMKRFALTGEAVEVIAANRKDEIGDLARDFYDMQLRLIQREMDMLKLEKAKSEFLHLISHEIRTPLNGILGSAYFLKEQYAGGEASEFIDMLTESADRLENLSAKALMITELNAWTKDLNKENTSLTTVLSEAEAQCKTMLSERQIKLNHNYDPSEQFPVIKDVLVMAVKEIIHNTCVSAYEDSMLTVSVLRSMSAFTISFTNRGPVIEPERLELLGKPFELVEDHHDKHTGLGLAVVSTIMQMHGGKMKIENDGDAGVVTKLIFPLK